MSAEKLLTHNDETLSLSEWARRLGMKRATLKQRINKFKFSVERALTAPVVIGTQYPEGRIRRDGYRVMRVNGAPVLEHILIAERALGRELRSPEEVHHFNEVRSDNRNDNLVICPDYAYHSLLHLRQKAFAACGIASYRRCKFCGVFDDPSNMYQGSSMFYHHDCLVPVQRKYRNSKKESQCQPKP